MAEKKATDEINLLEIFLTIMNNKMKIVLIVVLSMAVASGFQYIQANKVTPKKFITKLSSNNMLDEDPNYKDVIIYIDSKNVNINRTSLFALFLDILKVEIVGLVEENNFIKKKDYKDTKTYEIALNKIISKINIVTDKDNEDGIIEFTSDNEDRIIEFTSDNEDEINKWLNLLDTLEYSLNKKTQEYLKNLINSKLERDKFNKKRNLEDIKTEIKNELKFYQLEKYNRLSFLKEQAKIAREGNVESEKVTPSSFGSNYSINYNENGLLSLYYLKGYRVIEKEIELIEKRKDPYLFSKNIPSLQLRLYELENDQTIIREEAKLKRTAIYDDDKFSAGLVNIFTTEVLQDEYISSISSIIIFGLIGLIIGVFYVLISSAINSAIKRHRNND